MQTEEASKTEKEKALHIALQGKAGVNFSVNDMFVPYVGYKFLYMMPKEYTIKESAAPTDTATAQEDVKVSHMLHNLEAGIMIPMSV